MKTLKAPQKESKVTQDVKKDVFVSPVHQNGSAVQKQKVQKLPAFPVKPKADDFALPLVTDPVRETNVEVLPLERPVATSDTAPKDLQSPSAGGPFPPTPARTFALPKIIRSVEETKVTIEQKASFEETQVDAETMERAETSFEEAMVQKDLQSPSPQSFHHPSLVRSSALPQILQSVEELKFDAETMERTETSFEEKMAQKDLQSPFPHSFHHPSPIRSSALPQILQSVEEPKVDAETMEGTETSFEETMAQKDLQSPFPHSFHRPSLVRSSALPQILQSVEEPKVDTETMERTATSFEASKVQKDLQSPSPQSFHHPSLVRSSALPQILQSVEETKVDAETMERTETSFEEKKVQKDLQSPSPQSFHRPSLVRSSALPQILQSVEEPKVDAETMERTETSFEKTMAQKDLQSPFPHSFHHPSLVRSSALPQILQSVEETKVDAETMERTETSFEETKVQKDLQSPFSQSFHRPSLVRSSTLPQISQSLEETNVYAMPVEERQSPSSVHNRPSSSVKLPKIRTQVKPSLQKYNKPETRKYDSVVSSSIEEQYMKNSVEDGDRLLLACMKDSSFIIDIKAQDNNLQQLDRAFQNNNISSEMYNLCRGTINQTLKSVELRLGCLLRRYIKHVQIKQLRSEKLPLAKLTI